MSQTNKLVTIVVPTRNRPNYVLAIIDFYSKYQLEKNLLFLDGSDNFFTKEVCNRFKIRHYLADQKDESSLPIGSHIYFRINKYARFIDTKQLLFMADDDVTSPNFILTASSLLQKKNETVSVINGHMFGFGYLQQKQVTMIYDQFSHTGDVYEDRLNKLSKFYSHNWLGLSNRDYFLDAINKLVKIEYKTGWFYQFVLSALMLERGKSLLIDCLMMLRREHSNRQQNIKNDEWTEFPDVMFNPLFSGDLLKTKIFLEENNLSEIASKRFCLSLIGRRFGVRNKPHGGAKFDKLISNIKNGVIDKETRELSLLINYIQETSISV